MPDLLSELRWRGALHQATPGLEAHLVRGPVTAYCGFDPTAPSLQVGNLVPLLLLERLQAAGHRPIVLMGGGTGLIGDPSGRRSERPLLSKDELRANLERQRNQMARFLDFAAGRALLLDNAAWLVPESLIDFLRDVGKHFTVNVMLQKESVQARLAEGLSYTEFSYMLLQAYDFLQLFRRHGCTLQVGGSDQWGNITAGVELVRRVEGAEAHALVTPLLTTASGAKFGKSEAGAVYLDAGMTSPYAFFQFWVNADDRDIPTYVKQFSGARREDVEALLAAHAATPAARKAQRALAEELTARVHGPEVARNVVQAAAILFGDFDPRAARADVLTLLARELPSAPAADGASLADAAAQAGLATSKSDARRAIAQGGLYLNGERVSDVNRVLGAGDRLAGGWVLLRKGKKDYALLTLPPD